MASFESAQQTPDDMVRILLTKDEVFQRMFNEVYEYCNLQPEEQERAQNIFQETFPNYHDLNVTRFHAQWMQDKIHQTMNAQQPDETPNETCRKLVYDGGTKSYLNARVLPLNRKRRQEKFNLGEFVRQKRTNGDYYQITFSDRESVEDLMEELNEDKARNDQRADITLNRIVEMVAILNSTCNYRILELHPERRIH
ncbi:uncharacterized protein NPIL_552061 [Nephila pilipes]|uniref:Uncharacterized protein n=1 Tax=Nephila pilipes TaxID=299642 RepID=A0A8X6PJX3_NEPPI|nr:uncharacterized protein NPIL_552061 [Nephila pilipes]